VILQDVGAWSDVEGYDFEHEDGATAIGSLADSVLESAAMFPPGSHSSAGTSAVGVDNGDVGSWWDDLSGIVQGGINAYRSRKAPKITSPGVVPSGYGRGPTIGGPPMSGSASWLPWAIGGVALVLLVRR
jgi:hypothetical protein